MPLLNATDCCPVPTSKPIVTMSRSANGTPTQTIFDNPVLLTRTSLEAVSISQYPPIASYQLVPRRLRILRSIRDGPPIGIGKDQCVTRSGKPIHQPQDGLPGHFIGPYEIH